MQTAGDVRIGVSGWRYPPWRSAFYPKSLGQRRELEFASRVFRSIEINGSFYSLQRPQSYAAWHDATPDDFVFAVKGPRFVTHMLRLRGVEAALANFFASGVARLRTKIGPILWQLPPKMRYDESLLLHFLLQLPRDTDEAAWLARGHNEKVEGRTAFDFSPGHRLRHALEVRDASFVNAGFIAMLRELDIALVVADAGERWPEYADLTSDFVYVRLHGASELYVSGYSPRAIACWARRLERWAQGEQADDVRVIDNGVAVAAAPRDVFCYFDNTAKKHAPENARALVRKLAVLACPSVQTAVRYPEA